MIILFSLLVWLIIEFVFFVLHRTPLNEEEMQIFVIIQTLHALMLLMKKLTIGKRNTNLHIKYYAKNSYSTILSKKIKRTILD